MHLYLGVLTLGIWLVGLSFYRLFSLYRSSQCPQCGKKNAKILILFVVILLLSLQLCWYVFYLVEIVPLHIVQDASMTGLSEDIDPNAPIEKDNLYESMKFVWKVGLLPSIGAYMTMYWPYILILWFGMITIINFTIPSFYRKKNQ